MENLEGILVTGGCGFIGSNFINYYFERNPNAFIVNLDAMYYCAKESNVSDMVRNSNRYSFVKGNICDGDLVLHLLSAYCIDTVVHFAAQSHVDDSFTDSGKYVQDNIVGTHTLLEGCRKYGKISRFIHISTDEVYGESLLGESEPLKNEQAVLCPTNPYAATKASAELMASSYFHSFKLPIIITRGNNVYGPNQYPEKLIPKFIKLLKENKLVTIQGDGSNVRGFLHVNDVVAAIECILLRGKIGEIYNIGSNPEDEYSVKKIAIGLIMMMKQGVDRNTANEWITYIEDRPFNDSRYFISNEKVKQLGWKIKVPFMEGLKQLIDNWT